VKEVTLAVDILLEALIDARSTVVEDFLRKVRTDEYCQDTIESGFAVILS
jgi:hypothetical protein